MAVIGVVAALLALLLSPPLGRVRHTSAHVHARNSIARMTFTVPAVAQTDGHNQTR